MRKEDIREELRRSFLALSLAAFAIVLASLGLLIGWLQLKAATGPARVSASTLPQQFSAAPGESLIVVAVTAALSTASATAIRVLYRMSPFVAVIASIPAACLTIFVCGLLANWLGFDLRQGERATALSDVLFYATIIAFCTLNGARVTRDFIGPVIQSRQERGEPSDGVAALVSVVLMGCVWAAFVAGGQRMLFSAFL